MTDQVIEHLMEIKERLATIEAKVDTHSDLKEQVDKNTEDIIKAKASLKTIKWVSGLVLVSIPASLAAVTRILKG